MKKTFGPIFKGIATTTVQCVENKRNLCGLIINDRFSDKEKLSVIRKKILEFKSRKDENEESCDMDQACEPDEELSKLDTDTMLAVTKIMEDLMAPIKKHHDLLEQIGSVLRNESITDKIKVDKITDLLI